MSDIGKLQLLNEKSRQEIELLQNEIKILIKEKIELIKKTKALEGK